MLDSTDCITCGQKLIEADVLGVSCHSKLKIKEELGRNITRKKVIRFNFISIITQSILMGGAIEIVTHRCVDF